MKASELRIGNWIQWSLTGIEIQMDGMLWNDLDQFIPIPLTEEWLERFGFERSGSTYRMGKFKYIVSELPKGETGYGFFIMYGAFELDIKPRYVHQLQNLYHSLTGEELTIKETTEE